MGLREFIQANTNWPGDARLHDAKQALDSYSDAQKAAGDHEETDEYLKLNQAVADAERDASPWARFMAGL